MFKGDYFVNAREQFADQFEPDEPGFLYRKSMRGEPVRVTAAERDAFIETFNRKLQILSRGFTAALIMLAMASIGYAMATDIELQDSWVYVGVSVLVMAFMLAWFRIWNAPAAELGRRAPVARARSRSEVRQIMLSEMSWGEIVATFVLILPLLAGNLPEDHAPMSTWNWVFLLLGGVGLLAWVLAAITKLRSR